MSDEPHAHELNLHIAAECVLETVAQLHASFIVLLIKLIGEGYLFLIISWEKSHLSTDVSDVFT